MMNASLEWQDLFTSRTGVSDDIFARVSGMTGCEWWKPDRAVWALSEGNAFILSSHLERSWIRRSQEQTCLTTGGGLCRWWFQGLRNLFKAVLKVAALGFKCIRYRYRTITALPSTVSIYGKSHLHLFHCLLFKYLVGMCFLAFFQHFIVPFFPWCSWGRGLVVNHELIFRELHMDRSFFHNNEDCN